MRKVLDLNVYMEFIGCIGKKKKKRLSKAACSLFRVQSLCVNYRKKNSSECLLNEFSSLQYQSLVPDIFFNENI